MTPNHKAWLYATVYYFIFLSSLPFYFYCLKVGSSGPPAQWVIVISHRHYTSLIQNLPPTSVHCTVYAGRA